MMKSAQFGSGFGDTIDVIDDRPHGQGRRRPAATCVNDSCTRGNSAKSCGTFIRLTGLFGSVLNKALINRVVASDV